MSLLGILGWAGARLEAAGLPACRAIPPGRGGRRSTAGAVCPGRHRAILPACPASRPVWSCRPCELRCCEEFSVLGLLVQVPARDKFCLSARGVLAVSTPRPRYYSLISSLLEKL